MPEPWFPAAAMTKAAPAPVFVRMLSSTDHGVLAESKQCFESNLDALVALCPERS